MRKLIKLFIGRYFNPELELTIRLFNALALAGAGISLLLGIVNIVAGTSVISGLLSVFMGVGLSVGLMHYANRSGNYIMCYIITIVSVFMLLFGALFFMGGGLDGGMASLFIFAIVFTFLMLEGRLLWNFVALELIYYSGVAILAYQCSWLVVPLDGELTKLIDIVICFALVSLAIGASLYAYVNIYKRQQRRLEAAMQEAERANQVKSDFLAHISHEIRTPANVMNGMIEMIYRESERENIREYAKDGKSAGGYLLSLINNVLDFSKMESDKQILYEAPFWMEELLLDIYSLSTMLNRKAEIKFEMRVGANIPEQLYGDSLQIKQMAMNLISNAFKYTTEGNVTLEVDVRAGGHDSNELILSITDTGVGIRKEDLERLFEPFERVEALSNRSIEGSGLGLAITRQLTELMHGKLEVESTYQKGSVFRLTIPLRTVSERKLELGKVDKDGKLVFRGHDRGKHTTFIAPEGRILIIDDNEMNLKVLKFLLKRTKVKVDIGTSGAQCVEQVAKKAYDLVLLDYMMPQMDGIETLRQLEQMPEKPIVVALTANAVAGAREMFLKEGFDDYLSKPVEAFRLEEVLLKYLPPEKVSRIDTASIPRIPVEQKEAFGKQLKEYDILLADGLSYCNEELEYYLETLRSFTSCYAKNKAEISSLLKERQGDHLRTKFHALKGNARNIGANELADLARRLEERCRLKAGQQYDYEYIELGMALMLFEWERVVTGANKFLQENEKLFEPEAPFEEITNQGDAIQQLRSIIECIRSLKHKEAVGGIKGLLSQESRPFKRSKLEAAITYLEELEYEKAEMTLMELIEDGR